jgi:hypothetical protein
MLRQRSKEFRIVLDPEPWIAARTPCESILLQKVSLGRELNLSEGDLR